MRSEDEFERRKQDVLSKLDKSSKGSWDKKIKKLCEKINRENEYYTTSSCAGRVVVMIDREKKGPGVFLWVSHDLIKFKDLKEVLERISTEKTRPSSPHPPAPKRLQTCETTRSPLERINDESGGGNDVEMKLKNNEMIKFKQEPCILHVACGDLKAAQKLVDLAREAGWKRSGIITTDKRFIVELMSTEKLELPIIDAMRKEKLLVEEDYLNVLVKKANENLVKTWKKIDKLYKSL